MQQLFEDDLDLWIDEKIPVDPYSLFENGGSEAHSAYSPWDGAAPTGHMPAGPRNTQGTQRLHPGTTYHDEQPSPRKKNGFSTWLIAALICVILVGAGTVGTLTAMPLITEFLQLDPDSSVGVNANAISDEVVRQEYRPLEAHTDSGNWEEVNAFSDTQETPSVTATATNETPSADELAAAEDTSTAYAWLPSSTQNYPMPYYRAHLTPELQNEYDNIFNILNVMGRSVSFAKPLSVPEMELLIDSVAADHPGVFWSDNSYSYYTSVDGLVYGMEFNYSMNVPEKEAMQAKIEEIVAPVVQHAKTLPNDYEKTKYFYEWLCETIQYSKDLSNIHSQTIKGAFIDRFTACAGYSRAFQYLCYCCDIPCIYVPGQGNGNDGQGWVAHAWNACEIDGVSVYEDVTWGDSDDPNLPYHYSFLDLTLEDMNKTNHVLKYPEAMPPAKDNHYEWWEMHNGWMGGYDIDAVANRCSSDISAGANTTYLMFSDAQAMEECYTEFTGADSPGARAIVTSQPTMFYSGLSYWVQKSDSLNMLIFVWY